jgi:hypothetical protein
MYFIASRLQKRCLNVNRPHVGILESARWHTELRARYHGERGFAVLYPHTTIKCGGLNLRSKIDKITTGIRALEDSLNQIEKFEKQRVKEAK